MIKIENVSKYYQNKPAVKNISFNIKKGEKVGFLGVNGAGKSTTMRLITGYYIPTSGNIKVNGIDPVKIEAKKYFGYLPENNPLPKELRVREYLICRANIKNIIGKKAQKEIDEILEKTKIKNVEKKIIGQLSKGYRQRVGMADAMIGEPEILILDEPTAGLDPRQADETINLINQLGENYTVFLSSHILSEVEKTCDKIVVIDQGQIIAQGSIKELYKKNVQERILKVEIITENFKQNELEKIREIKKIEIKKINENVNINIVVDAENDIRQKISEICVKYGWLIKHLAIEPVTLDMMFKNIIHKQTENKEN